MFIGRYDAESKNNFNFPSNSGGGNLDAELSLRSGPVFLSIKYLEDKSPIFNIGFKIRPY